MDSKEIVCVNCPMGCRINVTTENKEIISITGNNCPRGKEYALQETIRPMRILTTTIKINGGIHNVLPVITDKAIPLDLTYSCMDIIRNIKVDAPIHEGDVIVNNLLNTGANLIASRSME